MMVSVVSMSVMMMMSVVVVMRIKQQMSEQSSSVAVMMMMMLARFMTSLLDNHNLRLLLYDYGLRRRRLSIHYRLRIRGLNRRIPVCRLSIVVNIVWLSAVRIVFHFPALRKRGEIFFSSFFGTGSWESAKTTRSHPLTTR